MWKNLPNISPCVREKWDTDPTADDEDSSEEELAKWKNLNSFIARFMTNQTVIWLHLPVWQLRKALEWPLDDSKDITECQLWVASEWLIHCAGPIFKEMSSNPPDLDPSDAGSFRTGPLCDAEPLSVERWQFWRKRLSDVATDVSAGVAGHANEALRSMDAAEADV
ncbi:uncharacterized protein C8A04DRAFT_29926 [Dichotomopilus funicola]|uniref:Uncharacterized protein n=1 Tax=Dichotomopilus funicola TaxID=1934379 RepID=A0AAN6ZL49_9PEZI|nr:hypothetical protein C8A04DRAFT_29926 [Dichotomopilus funicola]